MDDNLEIVDKKNIITLIKELQYLNDDVLSKFDSDKNGNLLEKLSNLNNNLTDFVNDNKQLVKESKDSKKELEDLFIKLQDTKNLKIEVEKLKFDFVGKKEFDELQQLITYIKGFRSFMTKKLLKLIMHILS